MSGDEVRRDELAATLAARQELGPEYEQALVESLAERIGTTIDARIEARLAAARQAVAAPLTQAPHPTQLDRSHLALAMASLGMGIPLTAIAGGIAGVPGLVVAWAGIAVVNLAYALRSRRTP